MPSFEHQRHKPPQTLQRPRELVLVCPSLRSNVNLSRIARAAGCCAVTRMICASPARLDPKIARDATQVVHLETRRSLPPAVDELRAAGFHIVGLEQTSGSKSLHEFRFHRRTALVLGHERTGIATDLLERLDAVVEIPVWGSPHSFNVATAGTSAIYEYCRQVPVG